MKGLGDAYVLRADVHPDADTVTGVIIGTGMVGAVAVFVGHVVSTDTAVTIVIVAIATIAGGYRIADANLSPLHAAIALRVVVDRAPGHAAPHRTHCGADITAAAVADLAAEHRAGDAADHGGDGTARLGGTVRIAAVAVIAVVAIAIVGIAVVAIAITVFVAGVYVIGVAVVAALPRRRVGIAVIAAITIVDDRVHAHHARIIVIGFFAVAIRRAVVARGLRGCHAGSEQADGQHGGG